MKFIASLFCFYLFALTALPSVRALKMQFSEQCKNSCQKDNSSTDEPSGCEKGKIIMSLSFNPVLYETSKSAVADKLNVFTIRTKKENTIYKNVFISKYNSSIWQPPKISCVV